MGMYASTPILTLGDFREATKNLPDDTHLLAECEEDLKFNELSIEFILEPVLDNPWAVLMVGGQVWNYELDLDSRIDAKLNSA